MPLFPFPTLIGGQNPLGTTAGILENLRDRITGATEARKKDIQAKFTELRGDEPFAMAKPQQLTADQQSAQKSLLDRKPFILGSPKATTVARPRLTSMDSDFDDFNSVPTTIEFQFSPKVLTENVATTWAEANAMGRDHPILHWVRGNQQTISFEAICHSPSDFFKTHQALKEFVDGLKMAIARQPELGRPILWGFTWGDLDFGIVAIDSLGNIRYEDMQIARIEAQDQRPADVARFSGDSPTSYSSLTGYSGSRPPSGKRALLPRQVTFDIALRKWNSNPIEISKPQGVIKETVYATAKGGESWEHIAKRVYGQATLGEALRYRNPGDPDPIVGVIYKLPDKDIILDEIAEEPRSIPLARTEAGLLRFSEMMNLRGVARYPVRSLE